MFKLIARKKKLMAIAMAGMLAATAFNPTGCTITIDEQLIQDVLDQVSNLDWEATFQPGGHDGFGPHHPGDWDDNEDDSASSSDPSSV